MEVNASYIILLNYWLKSWLYFLVFQICVIRSVHHGPVSAEYAVTGTTYAPDGVIYDSAGLQVQDSTFVLILSKFGNLCLI